MRSKKLDYWLTITAEQPGIVYMGDRTRTELNTWCEMHGAPAKDCTALTVTAWTDGSGEVELKVIDRAPDGGPIKDDSGMFLKRHIVQSPLRAPLPAGVRSWGK